MKPVGLQLIACSSPVKSGLFVLFEEFNGVNIADIKKAGMLESREAMRLDGWKIRRLGCWFGVIELDWQI